MDLQTFLRQSTELADKTDAKEFAANWTGQLVSKGTSVFQQGEPNSKEVIILDGCAAAQIHGTDGNMVCVGMYVGPCIVTPNIARSRAGHSLVTLIALSDTLVAQMDSATLTDLMITNEPVRNWANGVLRDELGRKADREWCLAALGGADRLEWFRARYPTHETLFTHSLIASFLGITPVTLSRLRTRREAK